MIPSEVQFLLSAPNADSGYSLPGSVYNSNGAYCSTTQVDLAVPANNLFPDLTGQQNAGQQVDYQCVFVYNSDDTDAMISTTVWIPANSVTSTAVSWAIAADPTAVSNYTTNNVQALSIANPYIAPSGITSWTGPVSIATSGIQLGTIGPRQVYAFWIRRTASGTATANAQFTLQTTWEIT